MPELWRERTLVYGCLQLGRTAVRRDAPGIEAGEDILGRAQARATGTISKVDLGGIVVNGIAGDDVGRAAPKVARGVGRVQGAVDLPIGNCCARLRRKDHRKKKDRKDRSRSRSAVRTCGEFSAVRKVPAARASESMITIS